ncbi:unnamed protein product [Darwinula stevensoni]|uniref:Heat shock protein 70 n=1 Tax=Darwinula stevensoni TaxID=69355 RepID=A0A7R8XCQ7_9CRUS|nr:unnamed protein product [Darwinula stevensoni]CAG0892765.1 unnamed protein product [Darwinula stevensoni]
MDKASIDEVALVGGSTRILKIQDLVTTFFGANKICQNINPDEAVAYGAAVQAAILRKELSGEVLVMDVTGLSMGIEVIGGLMSIVVKRNTQIPFKKTKGYTTTKDNQTAVTCSVYQGERQMIKDNCLLGSFSLCNIPPAPKGVPKFEVTFEMDANGILQVSAVDRLSGTMNKIEISYKDRVTKEDIERMVEDAKKHREEDELNMKCLKAKNSLESYAIRIKSTIEDENNKSFPESDKKKVLDKCEETMKWLGTMERANLEEYERMQEELESLYNPIITKMYENPSSSDSDSSDLSDTNEDAKN